MANRFLSRYSIEIDAEDVRVLLNGSFVGDDYQHALQGRLRPLVDTWIDSGRTSEGEIPAARTYWQAAADKAAVTSLGPEHWRILWIELRAGSNEPLVDLRPVVGKKRTAKLRPSTEADRILTLLLASSWRFRIAKCRYVKCQRGPYFLLSEQEAGDVEPKKYGIGCCSDHRRRLAAIGRTENVRQKSRAARTHWFANYVRGFRDPEWHKDSRRRQLALAALNEHVRAQNSNAPLLKRIWHINDIQKEAYPEWQQPERGEHRRTVNREERTQRRRK